MHSEKEKFERLAKEKKCQDEKLQRVMRMVQNTPSPGRVPLGEKDVSECVMVRSDGVNVCEVHRVRVRE